MLSRACQFMYGSVENMARLRPDRLIVTNRKPNQDKLQACTCTLLVRTADAAPCAHKVRGFMPRLVPDPPVPFLVPSRITMPSVIIQEGAMPP